MLLHIHLVEEQTVKLPCACDCLSKKKKVKKKKLVSTCQFFSTVLEQKLIIYINTRECLSTDFCYENFRVVITKGISSCKNVLQICLHWPESLTDHSSAQIKFLRINSFLLWSGNTSKIDSVRMSRHYFCGPFSFIFIN